MYNSIHIMQWRRVSAWIHIHAFVVHEWASPTDRALREGMWPSSSLRATGALHGCFATTGLGSGCLGSDCWVVVAEVMTWLSIHTECRACCSCWESCEIVYCRMFACTIFLRCPFLGHRYSDTLVLALISSPLIAYISL